MGKSGRKKTRLISLNARKLNNSIYDVTLKDFADSSVTGRKGRLKKARNVFIEVARIKTSDIIDTTPVSDDEEKSALLDENNVSEQVDVIKQEKDENHLNYTEYPLKIWLLLAEYIRPEDVKSFSLICKNSLSVINTPFFWIALYKRYYRKVVIPECLSYRCLEMKKYLKQKVVRSLYYFYNPYALSVINNNMFSNETILIGTLCLHQGIKSLEENESNEGKQWIYTFKLTLKDSNESLIEEQSRFTDSYDISYNPDDRCRLLKIICKNFIKIPIVRGMRLRKMVSTAGNTTLKFSSAPLSNINSELGAVTICLHHKIKPSITPWWHPDYWDHRQCCFKKVTRQSVSF